MQPLGPGALGEIFDDAGGHAAGDAERIDDLLCVQAERGADAGGGAHGAEDRGRMEAGFVHGLRHHRRQPAHHLAADGDADERGLAVRPVALAGRQHRRHDHRAGMHRAAFEGVVEILAMRGRAIDEGGAGGRQRARMADRRARTVIVEAGERAFDVVLVARGDAEAGDIDQQILAFAAHGGGQLGRVEAGDAAANCSAIEGRRCSSRSRQRRAPNFGRLLATATTTKVMTSMVRPSTAMAARSPLSLRS